MDVDLNFNDLELPLDDSNYWLSARKFQKKYHNLKSGSLVDESKIVSARF